MNWPEILPASPTQQLFLCTGPDYPQERYKKNDSPGNYNRYNKVHVNFVQVEDEKVVWLKEI